MIYQEPKPYTPAQQSALDAELQSCQWYTVNGEQHYWTPEEYARFMEGKTK